MKSLVKILLILVPVILVFKNVFWGGHLAGGDAPFFYPEGLRELVSEPLTWTQRGNNFGGANLVLWLSPLMLLYGILGSIRLIFYIPSIVLAGMGPYFLTRYLKYSKTVSFFASLFYVLNTYFILLIDGGQVGVALAYGLFPLALLFLKKLIDKPSLNNFFLALLFLFFEGVADPRIALICLFTLVLWNIKSIRNLAPLIPLVLAWLGLNAYWLYPLVKINSSFTSAGILNVNFVNLLHSLFLFQPHWPGNEFGKISSPSFYFALLPILVFGGLLFKQKDKNTLLFTFSYLVLAILATGLNNLASKLPLGFAFRDSSKFFIPLVLFGGILIGETVSGLRSKSKIFSVLVYCYLLLLLTPALLGKLNFNLSNRKVNSDFQIIYDKLKDDAGSFRTAWFSEKPPLAFAIAEKPAIDAKDLIKASPFARMNASEDVFNFLNNPAYLDWFKILGIKYLILSGNPRNVTPTQEDLKNWNAVLSLVDKTPGLIKVNWGTGFPVYEVSEIFPKSYAVDQLIAVVGPELVSSAQSLVPSIYFEDGKWDPRILEGKNSAAVKVYFNGKDKTDLALSFLQKYFVSTEKSKISQWAIYSPNQYLKAKYELLIRGIKYQDFDYGKGIALSTKLGEAIKFKFKVPKDGDYILAKRLATYEKQNLSWVLEERKLKKGDFEYLITNTSGLEILNVVAFIPKDDFVKADSLAETFIQHFGTINEKKIKDIGRENVDLEKEGTLKYKFAPSTQGYWLIFTENYHPLWKLKRGIDYFDSIPVYSMVNGFYVDKKWGDLGIEFKGQDYFRWGAWLSTISVLLLLICKIYFSKSKI